MSDLSVLFLTEGTDSPSARFAVTALVPLLQTRGLRCTVAPRRPEKYALPHLPCLDRRPLRLAAFALFWYPRSLLLRLGDLSRAGAHDVVFVQRDLDENHTTAWLERLFRRRARRLVFYFDDAIWLSDNHRGASLERKVQAILALADCVLVSHAYLAEYAARFNPAVHIHPLSIDTARFTPRQGERESPRVTIGWTGGPWNYPELLELAGVLEKVRAETGAGILIQSGAPLPPELQRLGAEHLPWRPDREVAGLQRMDIAICPLRDTPWTRGKFSIKLLQYQAVGIPVVCSDVGANREIIEDGRTGFLVRSPAQWQARLLELVRSRELRLRLGAAGRERAVAVYPREKAAARLADRLRALASAPGARP